MLWMSLQKYLHHDVHATYAVSVLNGKHDFTIVVSMQIDLAVLGICFGAGLFQIILN